MTKYTGYLSYTREHSFSLLLLAIVLFLFSPPFFENSIWEILVSHGTLTLVLLACLWVIFGLQKHPVQPIIVGFVVIGLNWAAFFQQGNEVAWIGRLLAFVAFWTFTTFRILKRIAAQRNVNIETLAGAISGYLLFGLIGALVAACLELVIPGSFNIQNPENLGVFVYFSFVTLSTLGYGDILPITQLAQTLSIAISLTGQIYLTIIIAILVGKFISQSN